MKKRIGNLFVFVYGRLLNDSVRKAPTKATAKITPNAEYNTYASVLLGGIGSGSSEAGGAGSTEKAVVACEG